MKNIIKLVVCLLFCVGAYADERTQKVVAKSIASPIRTVEFSVDNSVLLDYHQKGVWAPESGKQPFDLVEMVRRATAVIRSERGIQEKLSLAAVILNHDRLALKEVGGEVVYRKIWFVTVQFYGRTVDDRPYDVASDLTVVMLLDNTIADMSFRLRQPREGSGGLDRK